MLPGGLGTLDELLEVVTLRQLGYHDKPILLVDIGGYLAAPAGPCSTSSSRRLRRSRPRRGCYELRAGRGRGWCRLRGRARPAGPPDRPRRLGLRLAALLHLRRNSATKSIGSIIKRREAAVARGVGDDPAREREQQPRAFDQQQRLQAVRRDVGEREHAAIGQLDQEHLARRRPWRRRSGRARPRSGRRRSAARSRRPGSGSPAAAGRLQADGCARVLERQVLDVLRQDGEARALLASLAPATAAVGLLGLSVMSCAPSGGAGASSRAEPDEVGVVQLVPRSGRG